MKRNRQNNIQCFLLTLLKEVPAYIFCGGNVVHVCIFKVPCDLKEKSCVMLSHAPVPETIEVLMLVTWTNNLTSASLNISQSIACLENFKLLDINSFRAAWQQQHPFVYSLAAR